MYKKFAAILLPLFLSVIGAGIYFTKKVPPPAASEIEAGMEPELEVIPPAPEVTRPSFPSYTGQPIRELGADAKTAAYVGAALVDKYQKNLAEIAVRLEENPSNYDDWLSIAYIKKLFRNLPGARDAWEYAKVVGPDNPVAYFNLGELYGYELKEPAKAEGNYKTALKLNSYHLDYYIGLANFYEEVLKNPDKAEEIWLSALDKIPHTEVNLFTEIGAFYRDQKNYTKAIEYFEKALGAADKQGDPAVKEAVQNELDYIRSKQ